MSAPKYLYKILDQAPPKPLPETLPATSLDANDGFIHLSNAEQTKYTAKMFFGSCNELWILKIAREQLDGDIEYFTEPSYEVDGGCPHVHNSKKGLGNGNVVEVVHVTRENEQDWTQVQGMSNL